MNSPETTSEDGTPLLAKTVDQETSDIINGLLHTADDHPCCKGIILAAASLLLKYSKSLNQIYPN